MKMIEIQKLNAISDIIYTELPSDKYTVTADAQNPDAILVRSAAMHDMELGDKLLAVARAGAGVNNIPIDKCSEKGIVVFNTPGANANAVAELVMAGLLLSSRNVLGGAAWAQGLKGNGDQVPKMVEKGKSQFVGPELRGKTLGVIGLGAIGAIVANTAARGFGMKVIGYDPFLSVENAWKISSSVQRAANTDEVLAAADYITFHIPLTDKTRGTINADMIAKMKPGVRILNYSRAELADAEDMKAALANGKVSVYVTDFATEAMLDVPNAICLPHLGASTPESEENCAQMAAAEIRDYVENGSIHNSVNLPEVQLSRPEGARVLVIHQNIPNMLAKISACISAEGINIGSMVNKSKKEMAVTVIDVPSLPTEAALAQINAIDGVIRVRSFAE